MNIILILSAEQVKYCIEKSAVVPPSSLKVIEPGSNKESKDYRNFKNGGIVNAYEAIKLASTLKGERTTQSNETILILE